MHIESKSQIIFVDNLKPLLLRKTAYWQRPALRGHFNQNPYQASTPPLDPRIPYWTVQGLGLRVCAWLAGPSPVIMALLLFWLVNAMGLGVSVDAVTGRTNRGPVCTYLTTHGALDYLARDISREQRCTWVAFNLGYEN
jgi:type IV secretion system protein VirD4